MSLIRLWFVFLGTALLVVPAQAVTHFYFPTNHDANQACSNGSNTLSEGWLGWQSPTVPPAFPQCPPRPPCYHYVDDQPGEQYWYHHLQDCGGCPDGYSPQGPYSECVADSVPVVCPVGDEQRFYADAGEPIPDHICSNGCWYERKYVDVPVTFNLGGTAWTGTFVSTGNACDLLQDETGGGGAPENCISDSVGNTFCAGYGPDQAPPNCMEANGQQVCLDPVAPQNCGYINGTQLCLDDYPDEGVCHFIPGGSYICFADAETGPTSPPYPDTGTPGVPATPDVTMEPGNETGTGPGDALDYFAWDTVQQSSGEGGAPGSGSDTTPPQEPLEIEGPIEIDESGTPNYGQENVSLFDAIFDGIGLGGAY